MLKKPIVYMLSALTLMACQSQSIYTANSTTFTGASSSTIKSTNVTGRYQTAIEAEGSYQQTLTIMPDGDYYQVSFSASRVRGEPNCRFTGQGWMDNGVLWVDISNDDDKQVLMYIKPLGDNTGVEVFTQEFDERFEMMWYCKGGGSLAGKYIKVE